MEEIDFLFLDSGTGGLPYMVQLKQMAPAARCVYIGDTANFPYGEKTQKQIIEFSTAALRRGIERFKPKVAVIACNTMSVAALEIMRKTFDIPVVGTVPAIKLAATCSKNKKIGLLATAHTVKSPYIDLLINDFAKNCTVFRRGDSDLVRFVEHNLFTATSEERCNACKNAVEYFAQNQVDTVVLACTHFTHIFAEFEKTANGRLKAIDSREGVAKQALRVWAKKTGKNLKDLGFLQGENGKNIENIKNASEIGEKIGEKPKELKDSEVFVTSLGTIHNQNEYRQWCNYSGVPFMGLL